MNEREKGIIQYRFLEGRRYSLEEVGKEYKVTKERIRQIQNKALTKLRRAFERLQGYKTGMEDLPLDATRIPPRIISVLCDAEIKTVGQMRSKTTPQLLLIRNFGKKSLEICREILLKEHDIEVNW